MSNDRELLLGLAEALEAAGEVLRQRAARLERTPMPVTSDQIVEVVRGEHSFLGPRQAQILSHLAEAGSEGMTTGSLSKAMDYDQANLYIALQQLVAKGFVEKEASQNPHLYRLAKRYLAAS